MSKIIKFWRGHRDGFEGLPNRGSKSLAYQDGYRLGTMQSGRSDPSKPQEEEPTKRERDWEDGYVAGRARMADQIIYAIRHIDEEDKK
jgi:hypothetical protein